MALSRTIYEVVLAVALITREALGSSDGADERIINGTVVLFGDAPFQDSIQQDSFPYCGSGSIIDPYFVVTAAECCYSVSSDSLQIAAGLNHLTNPEDGFQKITVAGIIIHPDYVPDAFNADICILQLNESLIPSSESRTAMIKLPPAGYTASGLANVTGWGESDGTQTDALMRATVTIVPDNICREIYPTIFAGKQHNGHTYPVHNLKHSIEPNDNPGRRCFVFNFCIISLRYVP